MLAFDLARYQYSHSINQRCLAISMPHAQKVKRHSLSSAPWHTIHVENCGHNLNRPEAMLFCARSLNTADAAASISQPCIVELIWLAPFDDNNRKYRRTCILARSQFHPPLSMNVEALLHSWYWYSALHVRFGT